MVRLTDIVEKDQNSFLMSDCYIGRRSELMASKLSILFSRNAHSNEQSEELFLIIYSQIPISANVSVN